MWTLFARLLRRDWPWQIGALDESSPGQDTNRIVLTVIAGLGAAFALFVACRRQRNAELGRFDDAAACAARRRHRRRTLRRVYAMAALGRRLGPAPAAVHRRPVRACLRLPSDPSAGLLKRDRRRTRPAPADNDQRTGKPAPTNTCPTTAGPAHHQQHIAGHLGTTAAVAPRPRLGSATLDGGNFSNAPPLRRCVTFNVADFTDGIVIRDGADFRGLARHELDPEPVDPVPG